MDRYFPQVFPILQRFPIHVFFPQSNCPQARREYSLPVICHRMCFLTQTEYHGVPISIEKNWWSGEHNLISRDTLETSHQALFNRKVGKKLLAPWGVIINSEMITWVLSYSSISALTADFNTHNFTDTSRRFSSSFVVVFKDKKPPPSRVHVISKFIPYPNQPRRCGQRTTSKV